MTTTRTTAFLATTLLTLTSLPPHHLLTKLFLLTAILTREVSSETCPSPCTCMAVPPDNTTYHVVCPPGFTALPSGLGSETHTLVMTGGPRGGSNIPRLSRADLEALGQLVELTIPFAHLAQIDDRALALLPYLQRLTLNNNRLTRVTSETFAGLSALDYLDLTDNQGCVIEGDDVFSVMTSLTTLFLGGMGLKEVRSSWMSTLTKLESLDLHGNRIESLEPKFLAGLTKLKTLELTGNRLQGLSPSATEIYTSIPFVYLADNPWHCNCEVGWFKQLRVPSHRPEHPVCTTPDDLAMVDVDKAPEESLHCISPRIIGCRGPYDVTEGRGVMMTCEAEGDPFPTLTWVSPSGGVFDAVKPGYFYVARREVNTTALSAADFSGHNGQWTVQANSSQGSDVAHFVVNVITTTTTTSTTTTTTPTTTTAKPTTTKKDIEAVRTLEKPAAAPCADSPNLWFYAAIAAFGVTALALTSLILVAAVKIRKSRRQVGQDHRMGRRRSSVLTLGGPDMDADVTVLARGSHLDRNEWC